jgi:membrane protein
VRPRFESIAEQGRSMAERLAGWWADVEAQSVPAGLASDLVRRYQRTNASLIVGSLAYRVFLFLVPSALVVVAVAGSVNASGSDPGAEVGEPMRLGEALRTAISRAGEDSGTGWEVALMIGLAGILVSGYGLYGTLFRGYAQVWELSILEQRKRFASSARFIAGLVVFVGFLCVMAWVRGRGALIGGVGILVSIAVELVLFVLMSVALPHRGREWINMVPGAVAGGVATVGLQIAAATWLPNQIASRSQTYGVLGVAIALLAYLALLGSVLVLVPLVNATWYDHVEGGGRANPLPALADRALAVVKKPKGQDPPLGG